MTTERNAALPIAEGEAWLCPRCGKRVAIAEKQRHHTLGGGVLRVKLAEHDCVTPPKRSIFEWLGDVLSGHPRRAP